MSLITSNDFDHKQRIDFSRYTHFACCDIKSLFYKKVR